MIVSLIVAMSENHVIGRDQKLPWHISEDLKRFKRLTSGHAVIMGRKTFESIGRPLPNRQNIVISRQGRTIDGVKVVSSLEAALSSFRNTEEEVFVLGGGQIFKEALPLADRLYLTLIHQNIEGDIYFPDLDFSSFELVFEEKHGGPLPFSFRDYLKKQI